MVGKSIRQTMFRQSKGYPTAYRGWQGEKGCLDNRKGTLQHTGAGKGRKDTIHPPPISRKNKL